MTDRQIEREYKSEGVIRWVTITIDRMLGRPDGSIDWYHRERLFQYSWPRDVYERRKWVLDWRCARLKCSFPRDRIQAGFHYFDKKTGISLHDGPINKMIAAKRNITRIKNKMATAKANYIPTLYNPTIESNAEWGKAEAKLKEYETMLELHKNEIKRCKNL